MTKHERCERITSIIMGEWYNMKEVLEEALIDCERSMVVPYDETATKASIKALIGEAFKHEGIIKHVAARQVDVLRRLQQEALELFDEIDGEGESEATP